MQDLLPTAEGGSQPLPEGLLWLLLTGELPTKSQVKGLSADLMSRSQIPSHITMMLRSLPPGTHPMTQLSMAIMALQPDSIFAKQYSAGIGFLHRQPMLPSQIQHIRRAASIMRRQSCIGPRSRALVRSLV